MERTGTEPKDFDYAVFHQPNGKFPVRAAKILGFSEKQFQKSLVTPFVGNTYSGSSLLGLCSVLDEAKDGQLILLVSYGSGAGSDGFVLKTTKHIEESGRKPLLSIRGEIEREKEYVSYAEYAKNRRKLKL
jgi:hydroxymethylglutaryl-CoA synthase